MLYDDPNLMIYTVVIMFSSSMAIVLGVSILTGMFNRFLRKM